MICQSELPHSFLFFILKIISLKLNNFFLWGLPITEQIISSFFKIIKNFGWVEKNKNILTIKNMFF